MFHRNFLKNISRQEHSVKDTEESIILEIQFWCWTKIKYENFFLLVFILRRIGTQTRKITNGHICLVSFYMTL